ncbi:MAG TPA: hypothetical protein VFE46_13255 [Pirellulales bacterium]|jgi:hypothetical protein|nr:hypothetical protein [Pirellulales bacterium]
MLILSQFVLRLSLGLAFAMAITSPKKVTSGYFRNHAYVLLGLNVLAVLAALADQSQLLLAPPIVAAVASYLCAAAWLYEKPKLGTTLLVLILYFSFVGACSDLQVQQSGYVQSYQNVFFLVPGMFSHFILRLFISFFLDPLTAGLLVGGTLAAMFLGHWYLNSPTMEIAPLKKLLKLMAIAAVARAAVCLTAMLLMLWQGQELSTVQTWLLVLRWTAGILGTTALTWMAWETLKIPNTQSCTGILYVAVLATFLGELTSLLLSAGTGYPL